MSTTYNVSLTIDCEEEKAPENWQLEALDDIIEIIKDGFNQGEIIVFENDKAFRVWWSINGR